MNVLEDAVYDVVKEHPWLKNAVRTAYQASTLPWIGRKHTCPYPISTRSGFFFGFHDKSPWCPENRRVLAHRISDPFNPGRSAVQVGFFRDGSLSEFVAVDTTVAWSKQQGAQLQWCGTQGEMIYNTKKPDGHPGAVITTEDNDVHRILEYPIGAVDSVGRFVSALEYGAFGLGLPGYGYGEWTRKVYRRRAFDDPAVGLTEIDLSTGVVAVRRTLPEVMERVGWARDPSWHNFLSHPAYSPDDQKLAFFLRRTTGRRRPETKICVYHRETDDLIVLPSGKMASHYCWLNSETLLAYLESRDQEDTFQVLSAESGSVENAEGLQEVDGHPNLSPGGKNLVIDTYPNRRRRQVLSIYRWEGGRSFSRIDKMCFYSPLTFRNEDRVDLHPRWDREGRRLCVDSSYRGERSLSVIAWS